MVKLDPYRLADRAIPFLKMWFGYNSIGTENLTKAAEKGFVVVATTHASFLGAVITGLAARTTLNDEPYVVLHQRLKNDPFEYFFVRGLHSTYVDDNGSNNLQALRDIEKVIIERQTKTGNHVKSLIVAPQGDVNYPDPKKLKFKEGFAIPLIHAVDAGINVQIVPAIDHGIPYANHWSNAISKLIIPGRIRATAIFGKPIDVQPQMRRGELTRRVEEAVKDLMKKYA